MNIIKFHSALLVFICLFACSSSKFKVGSYEHTGSGRYGPYSITISDNHEYKVSGVSLNCRCIAQGIGTWYRLGDSLFLIDKYVKQGIQSELAKTQSINCKDSIEIIGDTGAYCDFPVLEVWKDSNTKAVSLFMLQYKTEIGDVDSFQISYSPQNSFMNQRFETHIYETTNDSCSSYVLSIKKPNFRKYIMLNDTFLVKLGYIQNIRTSEKLYLKEN